MDNRFLCRGKRLDNGEWIYGYFHEKYYLRYGKGTFEPVIEVTTRHNGREDYPVDPSTVGQCIGLFAAKSYRGTDPEELLVFEGDIVNTVFGNTKAVWSCDYKRWFFIGVDTQRVLEPGRDFNGFEVEIIGTVYEPPDLLDTLKKYNHIRDTMPDDITSKTLMDAVKESDLIEKITPEQFLSETALSKLTDEQKNILFSIITAEFESDEKKLR